MDIATLLGPILGLSFIVILGIGPANILMFVDPPSAAITVGGATSSLLLAFPLNRVMSAFGVAKNALFIKSLAPNETIKLLVKFAEQARREGILALESRAQEIDDDFLKKGVQLAVDGTEPELIKDILTTEMSFIEDRHKQGYDLWDMYGAMLPAFGMIGTLIGLILMLANMSDPSSIGPAMAVALITTLYGAIAANLIAIPLNNKLKAYSAKELMVKELMLEGIMSLQSGDNPRIVEQKLVAFVDPATRADIMKKEEGE